MAVLLTKEQVDNVNLGNSFLSNDVMKRLRYGYYELSVALVAMNPEIVPGLVVARVSLPDHDPDRRHRTVRLETRDGHVVDMRFIERMRSTVPR